MKRRMLAALLFVCLFAVSFAHGEGLLPTLSNAYGIAMPSLTEALGRYPEREETVDGAAVEHWTGITEDDFNTFGLYLNQAGAALQDYRVEGLVFTATVAKGGRTFDFVFDTNSETAVVTYPAGTYDERLFAVKSVWNAAEEAETAGRYSEAAKKYASLIRYEGANVCYRDSDQRELHCYYAEGEAKRAAQDWEGAVAAFGKAGNFNDAATQIKETHYQYASLLLANGNAGGALNIFNTLKGYKDVDSLLANDHNLTAAAAARDAKYSVGNYVTFGHYPQTSGGNDNTEIEWLVLARDGNKALLISRYGLDAKQYNESWVDITWEKCTLRTWLNGIFLSKAFTAQEQKGILTTSVDNSESQGYSGYNTNGGNNTQDKIFLLSYAEANNYFGVQHYSVSGSGNNTRSRVAPTAYANKQGASTSSSNKTADGTAAGWWWLRSPGIYQDYPAGVNNDGSLSSNRVYYDGGCVRPALWINLESDIF